MVVTEVIVGAVRSIMMIVEAGESTLGPVWVPVTVFASNCGRRDPSPQLDTEIVKVVPVDVSGVNVHPEAVPALEKSEPVSPVMVCVIVIE